MDAPGRIAWQPRPAKREHPAADAEDAPPPTDWPLGRNPREDERPDSAAGLDVDSAAPSRPVPSLA